MSDEDTIRSFPFRVVPFAHQREGLERSYRKRAYAFFMDPGTGKTKLAIDTTALWFLRGKITGLLVAAPNDVHEQWVREQIAEHMPKQVKTRCVVWEGSAMRVSKRTRVPSRRYREALQLCTHPRANTLHVLAMNHEALATKKGVRMAQQFLRAHPSLFVLDESHGFMNPRAARTKAVIALAPLAFGRRIMTGTETDGDPFDYYAQFEFLDPRILDQDSFLAFKHRYGVWIVEHARAQKKMAFNHKTGQMERKLVKFETLQEHQRLEELSARLAPFVYRAKKRECLDLPPCLQSRLPTHLSNAQRDVYDALLDEGCVLLERAEQGKKVRVMDMGLITDEELLARIDDPRARVTMQIKLTLTLRLQQCVGGFVTDDTGTVRAIDATWRATPMLHDTAAKVRELARTAEGKIIVWAVFKAEIAALEGAINELMPAQTPRVVRIDGTVTGARREEAIAQFKDARSKRTVLVAHHRTMGTGQNLQVASEALFYSSPYSSIQRTQAQDRIDRAGQRYKTTLYDVIARDAPIQLDILQAHARKQDFIATFERMTAEAYRERMKRREC